jgi:protein involved in polysaccharide export with SLBB domain
MRKILKQIALFLVICLLNTVTSLPVLAAEADDVLSKLTPQQKQKIQNLSPAEKSRIQEKLGITPPVEMSEQPAPSAGEKTAPTETTPASKSDKPKETKELANPDSSFLGSEGDTSPIEQGFISKVGGGTAKPVKQFGYDIFRKTVGSQFALTSSLPIGPDYRINPGDKLLVTIWGNVNDTFALIVDERGVITLPKVGVVEVAGNTLAEAKDIIYKRLANVFIVDFNIDLTIKEIGPIKVYLLGDFVKPGAYTLTAINTLYDAIFIGGGPTKDGSLRKVELVRNGWTIKTVDLYDFVLTGSKKNDITLQTGDVVRIPPIGRVVAIGGNVRRPAIYELKSKTELSDFVGLAGGVTPTSYLQRVQIERQKQNQFETALDINYADYLKVRKVKPIYLEDRDLISILSIDSTIRNVVYLNGNVVRPGRYELEPNMRLMDLVVKADGLSPNTYMERAQIYRLTLPDMKPTILAIDLNQMKAGDPRHNPELKEFDRVRVYAKTELEGEPKVYISGEINDNDSISPLVKNMRVSDLIYQAGGVKASAYLEKAELARTDNKQQIVFYSLDLRKILTQKDENEDLLLKKGDYLFIRRIPDFDTNITVSLAGEVEFPGKYIIYKGERLSSIIARAGGYTSNAFLDGAVFTREQVRERQEHDQQKIKKELAENRLIELAQIPYGLPTDEAVYRAKMIEQKYNAAMADLQTEVPGRVLIDLPRLSAGNSQDIILQKGDYLFIPEKRIGVIVLGNVFSPGTILYERSKSIDDYIRACGGGLDDADLGAVRILHANGVMEKRGWGVGVRPGDTIFVPAKPIEVTRFQKPFDWNDFWDTAMKSTTVMAQAATALVTVYLLYKTANK